MVASAPPNGWAAARIGASFRPSYHRRVKSGFMERFLSGSRILDIGYRGGDPAAAPITPEAVGIELDYPGYDGITLPFPDGSQDAVLAAHVLEHIVDYAQSLAEWYRVLRIGGYMVIMVPHKYLFERRPELPSHWNGDHKRFYTCATLLAEIEHSLPINGFRIRHMVENDVGFDYTISTETRPRPCYEIELVLEKIDRPEWSDQLEFDKRQKELVNQASIEIYKRVAQILKGQNYHDMNTGEEPEFAYIPSYLQIKKRFVEDGAPELRGEKISEMELRNALQSVLEYVAFDEEFYKMIYPDIVRAVENGILKSENIRKNWVRFGYFQGRVASRLKF